VQHSTVLGPVVARYDAAVSVSAPRRDLMT
jgi:hypothetical protein